MNRKQVLRPLLVSPIVVLLAGCRFGWEPAYDEVQSPEEWESVDIAEATEALTFARFERDGEEHVLLVKSYQADVVQGVDLTEQYNEPSLDPIGLFQSYGFDELAKNANEESDVTVTKDELLVPVNLGNHHIAAGTNFPEHAEEAGVEEGPYLFPKIVEPSHFESEVAVRKGLLDYEVELGWVTLEPLIQGNSPRYMGLILCNDYTDRDTLLRNLDPGDVESGDGFTTAKSFDGYLPVGNLFVIPRDFREFSAEIELQLFVNTELRQRSKVSRAVWDLDEIVEQTWARNAQTWDHNGTQVSLFSEKPGVLAERVVLLSGTPHGVIFNEITAEQKVTGLFDFLFGGWGQSVPDHAIEDYITDARAEGIYLMPGDRVDIFVQQMGVIENRIVE